MNWFKNAKSREEAQSRFRALSKIYHPDVGNEPDGELFAELSQQYKDKLQDLKNPNRRKNKTEPPPKREQDTEQDTEHAREQVAEYLPKKPRFNEKQKKHLVKGASSLFTVFAEKLVDRIN